MGSILSFQNSNIKHLDDFYIIDELIDYIGKPNKINKKHLYKHIYYWEEIIAHVRPEDNSIITIIENK